jgi:ubiquinone/menaquinone biosynthesis C-methylase UbiE
VAGNAELLSKLHCEMSQFYGERDRRQRYQEMLEQQDDSPAETSVRHLMPKYICDLEPGRILEVGCGDGRLYRQLRALGYAGHYVGVDVADYLIRNNQQRHPEADWRVADAYNIPFDAGEFDVCFSLYVLEHLVYPESALREMTRILRGDGRLVLVFPDFAESGRFGSQQLGLSHTGTASKRLRDGKIIDALVSLYDSRVRLPRALRRAVTARGPFPVNTRPLCLYYPEIMVPDVDAIYVASKSEVDGWAHRNGLEIEYPCGTVGEFAEQAFLVITKS